PWKDNGIKIFSAEGRKLPDAVEINIERRIATSAASPPADVHRDLLLGADYVAHLVRSLPHRLDGLKVVIDAAHGAAFEVAPAAFGAAGAEVFARNVAPDGRNINEGCGALHPEGMTRAVIETGASLGIALDGDADRIIVADDTGTLLDGDDVLYLWTLELEREGRKPEAVVGTVMSNWGLEKALKDRGVRLIRAAVGDRYVVEEMEKTGTLLGGEQSGHLIRADLTTTGDGTLTGLHIAALVAASGRPLSAQPRFVHTPQVLKNVRVREKTPFEAIPGFAARRRVAEQRLAGNGRLLLRYSGTEALARVMVEGADAALVDSVARDLADALRESLGS
ncbi:MAG: phosphoglucosamine mutase, partial [Thermoanaerobaculia bacterium]